jgi:hypothetical protein
MGISTSVLYELIVLANLVVLAVAAAIVVGLLRWALRRWTSIWPKTIAIHVVNFIVALIAVPTIIRLFPTLWFAELTIGSIVDFCFWLMIADGVRVWTKTQPALIRPVRGLIPLALFFAICGLAFLAARMSVPPGGKAALEEARLTVSVYRSFAQQSPQREIVDAMRKVFPKELEAIMKPYIGQVVAEYAHSHHIEVLPKFPLDKVASLLASRRYDIARAPDSDLAKVAKLFSAYADFFTKNHVSCSVEAGGVLTMHVPNFNKPLSQSDGRLLGQLFAAEIFAAHEGANHPVYRDISRARALDFDTLFRSSLPLKLQRSLDDQIGAASLESGGCDADLMTARTRWIAALPATDAANYLAIAFSYGLWPAVVAVPSTG